MKALRPLCLAAALLASMPLTGCLISGDTKTETSGRYVGDETLAQITPGKSPEFVLALLGEPSTRTQLSDGSEIWKWAHVERKKSQSGVIFLLGTKTETEKTRTAFVAFKDGVVEKAWRD